MDPVLPLVLLAQRLERIRGAGGGEHEQRRPAGRPVTAREQERSEQGPGKTAHGRVIADLPSGKALASERVDAALPGAGRRRAPEEGSVAARC